MTLKHRAFSLIGSEPMVPMDGRYHRIPQLGSCRFFARKPNASFDCIGASYPPCMGRRWCRDNESLQDIDYCPPSRLLQLFRWPLPYAFAKIDRPDWEMIDAITVWRDEGLFERSFKMSEAEFQRSLKSVTTDIDLTPAASGAR